MVTPTYPGVYIEEIPSGVHTITGVASSITVFIGRAMRGPTDEPIVINSFGDFERIFGGLWLKSTLGYAVRDFYMNGGSQAIIVRLFHADDNNSSAKLSVGGLSLMATSQGAWGANLRASIDVGVSEEMVKVLGLDKKDLFNLTVWESTPGGSVEQFLNLTTKPGLRCIEKVLEAESKLVRWEGDYPVSPPAITVYSDLTDAELEVKNKQAALDALPTSDAVTNAQKAVDAANLIYTGAKALLSQIEADYDTLDFTAAEEATKHARKASTSELVNNISAAKTAVTESNGKLVDVTAKFNTRLEEANAQLDEKQSSLVAETDSTKKADKEIAVDSAIAIVLLAKQAFERVVKAGEAIEDAFTSLNAAKVEAEKIPQAVTQALEEILNAEASLQIAQTELEASRQPYDDTVRNAKEEVDAVTKFQEDLCKTSLSDATAALEAAKQKLKEAQKREAHDEITRAELALKDAREELTKARLLANQPAINAATQNVSAALSALEAAKTNAAGLVSDGDPLDANDFIGTDTEVDKKGLYALEKTDIFNLLCIPPYKQDQNVDSFLISAAASYCEKRRALLIVDSPSVWRDKAKAREQFTDTSMDYVGTHSANAALFFPRLKQPNPLRGNQMEEFAPCGTVAGVIARTDAQRGVWKAPAGLQASLIGVPQLNVPLTDLENGELNQLGINCLRAMPAAGPVIWGARTLQGNDRLASEWKYIPVRRTALFIEESLYRGLQWAVFEPNDEPLWSQIRLNVDSFMRILYRKGAFQGVMPSQAYFVQCDRDTNPQENIDLGIVTVRVGFAPLKPAEFIIVQISQKAGQTA